MNKNYSQTIPDKWNTMAKVFEALGDETRQRILLSFEKNEELTIKDLVDISPLKRSSVVNHLQTLEKAGIINREKRGKFVYYKINCQLIIQTCENTTDYVRKNLI